MALSFPLGVCVFPEPALNAPRLVGYPHYIHEILAHAGVCYRSISLEELGEQLSQLRLLVTVGEAVLPEETQARLREWVRQGGGWLSIGGLCRGVEDLLGAQRAMSPFQNGGWGGSVSMLGEGYLETTQHDHPILEHLAMSLHFFNGVSIQATEARVLARVLDAHQRPRERAAVVEHTVEQGRCILIAPDVTGTVVRIQQGTAITRDGVPAPDGIAPVCDGVLKTDDGAVLDWIFDRQPVPEAPGLDGFLQPIADQWREMLLRAICHLAVSLDVTLPILWLYPRNLPAIGHISHDTDGNEPAKGWNLLKLLEEVRINTTWCVILPGYPTDLMDSIRAAGHDLATHYNALNHPWAEAEFDRQWTELCALFAPEVPVANKNHYLRWQGDTEFYDWCARRGIRLDQSKGTSKTGEVGFIFGTCHPYFPVAPDGSLLDVLELPTLTQDLGRFAPEAAAVPMADAVKRHHGVLHLLFHPGNFGEGSETAHILRRAVQLGRSYGLEWWTARQINAWERARRQVQWSDYCQDAKEVRVSLRTGEPLHEATLLWLGPSTGLSVNGTERPTETTKRWGFAFQAATFDLPECAEIAVRCKSS